MGALYARRSARLILLRAFPGKGGVTPFSKSPCFLVPYHTGRSARTVCRVFYEQIARCQSRASSNGGLSPGRERQTDDDAHGDPDETNNHTPQLELQSSPTYVYIC
jgi:hypothetical protein